MSYNYAYVGSRLPAGSPIFFLREHRFAVQCRVVTLRAISRPCQNTASRVNYPVPVHHASTRPLGTKKLPVLNLEMLETSMMA